MIRSPAIRALAALLLTALALAGCRREPPAEDLAKAAGDPVAAVKAQARALRDNDLVRWSRLSLPPELHARSEALWNRRLAEATPAGDEDAREYAEIMARLTAPDAEAALMRDLEPKLQQFEAEVGGQWPLMQATASIFLSAAIEANTELAAAEKAHGRELADAVLDWAQPALITDRARARRAIAALSATARELDLPTLEQARALGMTPALEKGGVALAGLKQAALAYDLDLDAALDGVQAELLSTEGDQATVKVSYPLLGRTIAFETKMQRVGKGWYGAEAIRQAEAELAEAAHATGEALADDDGLATDAATGASAD
ncbi:MAG: hypothetical protein RBS06_00045 [Arenimonas caeni]|jgi:hypothetical protein|nr:hypothetical protein [Arenimonas caeni]MDY0020859.1 hypothetical protein [Arenimonas caeni]